MPKSEKSLPVALISKVGLEFFTADCWKGKMNASGREQEKTGTLLV